MVKYIQILRVCPPLRDKNLNYENWNNRRRGGWNDGGGYCFGGF